MFVIIRAFTIKVTFYLRITLMFLKVIHFKNRRHANICFLAHQKIKMISKSI